MLLAGFSVFRGVRQQQMRKEAGFLLSKLNDVDIKDVPDLVADIQPFRGRLDPALTQLVQSDSEPQRVRVRAALALLPSDAAQADWLCDVLVSSHADVRDFGVVRDALMPHAKRIIPRLIRILRDETQTRRIGDSTPFRERLVHTSDPTLRTYLIHGMDPRRMELTDLLSLLSNPDDEPVYTAVLQAVALHAEESMSAPLWERLRPALERAFQTHPDRLVHSLTSLILQRMRKGQPTEAVPSVDSNTPSASQTWFVNSVGQTMVVTRPDDVVDERLPDIQRPYAISTTELTVGQLRQFRPEHQQDTPRNDQIPRCQFSRPLRDRHVSVVESARGNPRIRMVLPTSRSALRAQLRSRTRISRKDRLSTANCE